MCYLNLVLSFKKTFSWLLANCPSKTIFYYILSPSCKMLWEGITCLSLAVVSTEGVKTSHVPEEESGFAAILWDRAVLVLSVVPGVGNLHCFKQFHVQRLAGKYFMEIQHNGMANTLKIPFTCILSEHITNSLCVYYSV